MRTFHEFIRAHEGNKLDELFGINLFGKSEPAAPKPEETPAQRYRRKIAQARGEGSTLTGTGDHSGGDVDKPKDGREAAYLAAWRRSGKK